MLPLSEESAAASFVGDTREHERIPLCFSDAVVATFPLVFQIQVAVPLLSFLKKASYRVFTILKTIVIWPTVTGFFKPPNTT